ncbi:MAG: L-threonylcarbamoyladenylate synthase [Clostridiales bacterium]|nr:L-threonylcarbamoyladenylate synthase [Clostridiales bacterium]
MKPISPIDEDIQKALEVLRRGGVILYPTDTVWGIGCDATCSEAVKRIYEIKQRSDSKAMIVLMQDVDDLWRYVDTVPEVALELIEATVRPLTIVYDHGINLAPELLAADGSVGIRITRERVSATLCRRLRRPLVSTSANISGQPAAALFHEIDETILKSVDYVMTSRRDDMERVLPSQVIKLSDSGVVKILRK